MLFATIILGIILLHGLYRHLRAHIYGFQGGGLRLHVTLQKNFIMISFWKYLYVSNNREYSRRLEVMIKMAKEDPEKFKELQLKVGKKFKK